MNDNIIHTDEMRMRMTQLEYEGLSEEEYKQEIKRIYLEESGEKFPAELEVYSTSNPNNFKSNNSGYEGTAVHIHSEKEDVSEMYVISEGSQTIEDWEYNGEGIFAGQDISQARGTNNFVNEAKRHFQLSDSTPITGLSHSLAHNNNATAHLMFDTFDDIYSVNGAQTNYYQLYNNDEKFEEAVNNKFSISPMESEEIYDINPNKLKSFAEDYFEEEGEDIHQIIYKNDPLYGVSGTRGFFELGDVDRIESDSDHSGLREIMDGIPDDEARELQALAIQFSKAKKDGDINDGLQELTGVNLDLIKRLQNDTVSTYFNSGLELDQMVEDMDEKVPDILAQVKKVTSNADDIFQQFVEAGYIKPNQKDLIVKELTNIESDLEDIEEQISDWKEDRFPSNYGFGQPSPNLGQIIFADIGAKEELIKKMDSITESFEKLDNEKLKDVLDLIKKDHQIPMVLNAILGEDNKTYEGTDMILTGSGNIKVNMSAAMRMYDKGQSLLEDKEEEIKKLEAAVEREIKDYYQRKKREVKRKIDDIEANPKTYSFLLTKHLPLMGMNKEMKHIHVEEEFESLKHADMESYIDKLNDSVEKGNSYIESYRKSIEDLFDEEENVATMFNLAEEVLG